MNQEKSNSRYYVTVIMDLLSILLAYYFALKNQGISIIMISEDYKYQLGILLMFLVYFMVSIGLKSLNTFVRFGPVTEAVNVITRNLMITGASAFLLCFKEQGEGLTYTFILQFFVIDLLLMEAWRVGYKQIMIIYYRNQSHRTKLLVVTVKKEIEKEYSKLYDWMTMEYEIIGLSVLDEDLKGKEYRGIPIVSNEEDFYEFVRVTAIDEILISLPGYPVTKLNSMILTLEHMGMVVNLNLNSFGLFPKEKRIQQFGGEYVFTYSTKVFRKTSLIQKRIMDILGACVGLVMTIVVGFIVVPMIKIESPGPAIFSQMRIGKNGRRFRMYKFRSMYQDAEQRKSELLVQNEMNGLMFKVSDDPRITKVGKFIRESSIDELPQFFNVLRGDMSLVGTRPPTEDEFLQYKNEHKRRLSLKPGITGLWQVSGRSNITDFDEVVKLDLEYIDHWSIANDIKILCKTVLVVVCKIGSK